MNTPAESLLGTQRRRVSLLDLAEPPDGTAPPDEEEPFAEPEEDHDDGDDV